MSEEQYWLQRTSGSIFSRVWDGTFREGSVRVLDGIARREEICITGIAEANLRDSERRPPPESRCSSHGAEGERAGVPDICVPIPRGAFAAFYIGMKRPGEKPRPLQFGWGEFLRPVGNRREWYDDDDTAWEAVCQYLGISPGS
jgi:hypothetical protein